MVFSNQKIHKSIIFLIVCVSLLINAWNQDFSYEFHRDEIKKIQFVQQNQQDFFHPLLMIQTAKIVNYFLGYSTPEQIVLIGRTISAICGALLCLIIFMIARKSLKFSSAALLALATAFSPILTVHAHYFKEDLIFALCILLALYFLLNFFEENGKRKWGVLGLSLGLAFSAKYLGLILLPIAILAPLCIVGLEKKNAYINLGKAFGVSILCFSIINYPLFFSLPTFLSGLGHEIHHAMSGHGFSAYQHHSPIAITAKDYFLSFHFIYSLVPGMTLVLAAMGSSYLMYLLIFWKKTHWQDRILALFTVTFYLTTELSPMKTFPDFMRYMIPIIPLLLYFAVKCAVSLNQTRFKVLKFALPLFVIGLGYSAWDSLNLVYFLKHDTRDEVVQWIALDHKRVRGELHSIPKSDVRTLSSLDVNQEASKGIEYLIASNFMYDRVYLANRLKNCPESVREAYVVYENLFQLPFIEFKPEYRSFACSNPTIRVIDIRKLKV